MRAGRTHPPWKLGHMLALVRLLQHGGGDYLCNQKRTVSSLPSHDASARREALDVGPSLGPNVHKDDFTGLVVFYLRQRSATIVS